jgi:hypothetical protein
MSWNSSPTRVEALARAQQANWNGSLKGRIPVAKPTTPGGAGDDLVIEDDVPVDDNSSDDSAYDQQVLFQQKSHIVVAPGPQLIHLDYVPIDNSEHLYWNGVYQPATEWTRAENTPVVIAQDPGKFLSIGDVLTVEYAYVSGDTYSPAMLDYTMIGSTSYDLSVSQSSIALPAGTQAGDLILLGFTGGWGSEYGWNPPGRGDCKDPRLSALWKGDFCSRRSGVFWGVAGADLSPISVDIAGVASPVGQFISSNLTVIRGVDGQLIVNPARVSVNSGTNGGSPGVINGLGGAGSGAVAFAFRCAGIGGVTPFTWPTDYTQLSGNGTYCGTSIAVTKQEVVNPESASCSSYWGAVTVGLAYG